MNFDIIIGNKKPYKDKSGHSHEEDRLVAAQPLMFGSTFNIRKLNNLPYHRVKAGQIEMVKKECLYNFKFIFCKLIATSCRYNIAFKWYLQNMLLFMIIYDYTRQLECLSVTCFVRNLETEFYFNNLCFRRNLIPWKLLIRLLQTELLRILYD